MENGNVEVRKLVNGIKTKTILVLYTGGTIGMKPSATGEFVPVQNEFEKTLRNLTHMSDTSVQTEKDELVLPDIRNIGVQIRYRILEFDPLLDSSNMGRNDWIKIAKTIKDNYDYYNGFVVLHGTDTLTYTASVLSFMFSNLRKNIVVTGSQLPLFDCRSDGRDNFINSLIFAAAYDIPEVTVFFGLRLFRGNRIAKVSCDRYHAFDSFNCDPIAIVGASIDVRHNSILKPEGTGPVQLHDKLEENINILHITPLLALSLVKSVCQPPTKGIVLLTYGTGNFPLNREDIITELRNASERGVIVVNCTQCPQGSVSPVYETGQLTKLINAISGNDMTSETALTKLSYVTGRNDLNLEQQRRMMQECIRGEFTT